MTSSSHQYENEEGLYSYLFCMIKGRSHIALKMNIYDPSSLVVTIFAWELYRAQQNLELGGGSRGSYHMAMSILNIKTDFSK